MYRHNKTNKTMNFYYHSMFLILCQSSLCQNKETVVIVKLICVYYIFGIPNTLYIWYSKYTEKNKTKSPMLLLYLAYRSLRID